MIKQFVQTEQPDQALFCAIGQFAISEVVHKALGVPVTGREGDIWLANFDKETPVGFAQLRIKGQTAHIRYLYASTDKQSEALAKAAIAAARVQGAMAVFTNDRENATLWGKFGFKLQHSHHGSFGRWERELQ